LGPKKWFMHNAAMGLLSMQH